MGDEVQSSGTPDGAVLLERQAELAQIDAALGAAGRGSGRLLVIEGHAGIGKSRLLEEAVAHARRAGLRVLRARPHELERDLPWGVALQLFETVVANATADERRRWLAGAAGLAEPLVLDRGAAEGVSHIHGLYWLAANLAEDRPLLLAIDDVHWADASSLRAVVYLAQRLEELPIAIVATLRPAEPGTSPLAAELRGHPAARVTALQPLSEGAVAELVRATRFPEAEDPFCHACASVTAGNPFLVTQLLAQLDADGATGAAPDAERVRRLVPEGVLRSLVLRFARLPAAAARLARSVSVFGAEVSLPLAAALAGLSAEAAAEAASTLEAVGVLARSVSLSFVHPLIRSSLYEQIAAAERARAHAGAAALLRAQHAPAGEIALHLLHAHRTGSRPAVQTLLEAAEAESARGAPEAAVRFLRRALEEPPTPEQRAEVLVALAGAEAAIGDPEAGARLAEAVALLPGGRERAEALMRLGRVHYAGARFEEAAAAYESALTELNGAPPELAREAEAIYLGVATFVPSRSHDVARRIGRLLDGGPHGAGPAERGLLVQTALARAFDAAPAEEVRALLRRGLGDGALLAQETSEGETIYIATGVQMMLHDYDEEIALLDEALDDARARGSVVAFANASYCRSIPLLGVGRVADSIADAQQSADCRRYGWEQFYPGAVFMLADGLALQGDEAGALRALDLMAGEDGRWYGIGLAGWLTGRGRVRLALGDPAGALADLLEGGRLWAESGQPKVSIVNWRAPAAIAAAQAGDFARARELAAEDLALARSSGAAGPLGVALRAAGLVTRRDGLELLAEAIDTLERSQSRLEHARTLLDFGAALGRAGKRVDARRHAARALELAERFGAHALAARAAAELTALGARPRRRAQTGLHALTPAERRVVEMAAQGMTNREIAQALFVTVKAIEWHLRNAYPKLGVAGKAELAGVIAPSA